MQMRPEFCAKFLCQWHVSGLGHKLKNKKEAGANDVCTGLMISVIVETQQIIQQNPSMIPCAVQEQKQFQFTSAQHCLKQQGDCNKRG